MKFRLSLETFDLPVQEIRRGYYSDVYFWRTKMILRQEKRTPAVLMQIFQKKEAVLCGVEEALAVLRAGTGFYRDPRKAFELFDELMVLKKEIRAARANINNQQFLKLWKERLKIEKELNNLWVTALKSLRIFSLKDGDRISPWETVMTIEGPYSYFSHLETVYLGILARRTRIATNVRKVVKAAGGKPILFFPARFDHYSVQTGDGYAAFVGGASLVSTDAQADWWGVKGAGTIPHALIAAFAGNTAAATIAFARNYPGINTISLVDFENDCVKTSLEVARRMKKAGLKLWGVRLDTSENMVDRSVAPLMGSFRPNGVCKELVWNVRKALDKGGFKDVKIVVSGGFNPEKIREFEKSGVPVDAYGVGSSLFAGSYDFTADIVRREGRPCAKAGREYRPNSRLKKVRIQ
jgi:nicotinate phosphoribosyltransferase